MRCASNAPAILNAPCKISEPYDFRHVVHVYYNFEKARFEGLTETFVQYLKASNATIAVIPLSVDTTAKRSSLNNTIAASKARLRRTRARSDTHVCQLQHSRVIGKCNNSVVARDAPIKSVALDIEEDLLLRVNQHFQVHFRQVPRLAVAGYEDRIPAVLIMLRHHFMMARGYEVPFIFRESPSKAERDRAIEEINTGVFSGSSHDVRVLADLLKVWFRELTVPILHQISPDRMEKLMQQIQKHEIGDIVQHMRSILSLTECEIVLWLVDLLVIVVQNRKVNLMGTDQLAIVIAPNLVRIETDNLMVAVSFSKAVVAVFRAIMIARYQALFGRACDSLVI